MEGLNQNFENGDAGPSDLNITVSHGLNQHQVVVPSNSTFGDLKSVVAEKIGLKPEMHKLLFRGKEKEDDDHLHTAGVKDNSKVLLIENSKPLQQSPEKVETQVISRGGEAVAAVRAEVDKLADQVAALQAAVDGKTKVDNKDFLYLGEMLMRQLLKLDGIEAEGEGRVQRKMEVRRVQSIVETIDNLKSRNANHISNNSETATVTTEWETFDHGGESVSSMPTEPSSTAAAIPSYNPTSTPIPTPVPEPSFDDSTNPFLSPISAAVPLPSPSSLPSSTKVTQDWERFD